MSIPNTQIPWSNPNVVGHSIDPYTQKIDPTEGFGAFDSILSSNWLGRRTIDIGGGEHDHNSSYLFHKFDIFQAVYDPYMRPQEHNDKILSIAMERPFDSCTSISVLNVIDTKEARLEHIKLCRSTIKECGSVFFKVWPGNGTGISEAKEGGYQNNRPLETYMNEIEDVFGKKNVFIDIDNQLIRTKKF